jgi:hypothetical protein
MKLFRDPIWNFVAAVGAIAALTFGYFYYTGSQQTKRLTVEILTNSSLVSVRDDVAKDIKVLYKDIPVKRVSVILLRLQNTGNSPIQESDYSRPVVISLSPSAEIGEASITETKPKNVDISIAKSTPYQAELSKSLLNPNDQVLIKILAINNDDTLQIGGRIAGISDINVSSVLTPDNQNPNGNLATWVLVLGIGSLIFAIFWTSDSGYRFRQARFGFDPAAHLYAEAQRYAIIGEHVHAIDRLARSFRWDKKYIEKAKSDFRFDQVRQSVRFKDLLDNYEQQDGSGTAKIDHQPER